MKDEEEMSSFLECRGCKKKVKQIRKHLRYSKECEKLYDPDELVNNSLKKDAERKRKERSNHSETRKEIERNKDAERKRRDKSNQSETRKEDERNKDAERKRRDRSNQSEAEKEKERRNAEEGMRNFRANQTPTQKQEGDKRQLRE